VFTKRTGEKALGFEGAFKLFFSLALAVALATLPMACGTQPDHKVDDASEIEFKAREAITDALTDDRSLDNNAINIIRRVKGGQYALETALNDLVDQTHSLLSLIADVPATSKLENRKLAQAQQLTAEYYRNRVHQLEACLSARTPAELEALYNQSKPGLDAARNQIRALLISYDPGLEKFLP
jgi:predicted  nucleic acid-binding Zn-ribbon protein